jgi:type II secretory pathway pseudopilin PulG
MTIRHRSYGPIKQKRGNTLVELLVALPLAGLLGAIAIAQILNVNALARRLNSSTEISRELRHAGEILASELRPLAGADLIAWSDTAIEFHGMVGSGVVCATPFPNAIELLPLHGDDALRTTWFATPQAGDDVWTIPTDTMPMPQAESWQASSLQSTASVATSPCTILPLLTNGLSATGAVQRITVTANLPHKPQAGTLLRISRRTRYSLYKASDGLWYLGRKSLGNTGWTTSQPVAGPLLSATNVGLRVLVRDSVESPIAFGNSRTPHSIGITLHSSSRWTRPTSQAGIADSLHLNITLRGGIR